ncbi:CotO family spore coat protein [Metabacillus sp. RGM 3146]|uniref:CotO family spore coat protein n=1 Tax=Metabacillus sp. RGM 3146 TaxID=3401092 RepID=UPI003B9CB753
MMSRKKDKGNEPLMYIIEPLIHDKPEPQRSILIKKKPKQNQTEEKQWNEFEGYQMAEGKTIMGLQKGMVVLLNLKETEHPMDVQPHMHQTDNKESNPDNNEDLKKYNIKIKSTENRGKEKFQKTDDLNTMEQRKLNNHTGKQNNLEAAGMENKIQSKSVIQTPQNKGLESQRRFEDIEADPFNPMIGVNGLFALSILPFTSEKEMSQREAEYSTEENTGNRIITELFDERKELIESGIKGLDATEIILGPEKEEIINPTFEDSEVLKLQQSQSEKEVTNEEIIITDEKALSKKGTESYTESNKEQFEEREKIIDPENNRFDLLNLEQEKDEGMNQEPKEPKDNSEKEMSKREAEYSAGEIIENTIIAELFEERKEVIESGIKGLDSTGIILEPEKEGVINPAFENSDASEALKFQQSQSEEAVINEEIKITGEKALSNKGTEAYTESNKEQFEEREKIIEPENNRFDLLNLEQEKDEGMNQEPKEPKDNSEKEMSKREAEYSAGEIIENTIIAELFEERKEVIESGIKGLDSTGIILEPEKEGVINPAFENSDASEALKFQQSQSEEAVINEEIKITGEKALSNKGTEAYTESNKEQFEEREKKIDPVNNRFDLLNFEQEKDEGMNQEPKEPKDNLEKEMSQREAEYSAGEIIENTIIAELFEERKEVIELEFKGFDLTEINLEPAREEVINPALEEAEVLKLQQSQSEKEVTNEEIIITEEKTLSKKGTESYTESNKEQFEEREKIIDPVNNRFDLLNLEQEKDEGMNQGLKEPKDNSEKEMSKREAGYSAEENTGNTIITELFEEKELIESGIKGLDSTEPAREEVTNPALENSDAPEVLNLQQSQCEEAVTNEEIKITGEEALPQKGTESYSESHIEQFEEREKIIEPVNNRFDLPKEPKDNLEKEMSKREAEYSAEEIIENTIIAELFEERKEVIQSGIKGLDSTGIILEPEKEGVINPALENSNAAEALKFQQSQSKKEVTNEEIIITEEKALSKKGTESYTESNKEQFEEREKIIDPVNNCFALLYLEPEKDEGINQEPQESKEAFKAQQGQNEETAMYMEMAKKHSPSEMNEAIEFLEDLHLLQGAESPNQLKVDGYFQEEVTAEETDLKNFEITTGNSESENERLEEQPAIGVNIQVKKEKISSVNHDKVFLRTIKKIRNEPFKSMSISEKIEFLAKLPANIIRVIVEVKTDKRCYFGLIRSFSKEEESLTLLNTNLLQFHEIKMKDIERLKIISL